MKAIVKTKRGKDNIELLDVAIPQIGKNEVLIEIKGACSMRN